MNTGCGHIALDGYINVDARNLPGVDFVCDVADLPFGPEAISEIQAAHLLEHFPQEMLRRKLLPHWRNVLRPGGQFVAIVPDLHAMMSELSKGDFEFEDFREVVFVLQEYEGDFHFNMFTPNSIVTILRDAGFTEVDLQAQGRRNGKCLEL